MSKIVVTSFVPSLAPQLEDIFFESSTVKSFSTPIKRAQFYYKYLGFYLEHYPDFIWVALNEDKQCIGYLLGAPESYSVLALQPHMEVFKQYFEKFPAHLHMNTHRDFRGLGVGKLLLRAFEAQIQTKRLKGFHAITTPGSANRIFYHREGLNQEFEVNSLLFMAKATL